VTSSEGRPAIDLGTRLALGIEEAAEALGISPNLLREYLPELPKVYFGRRVVFPVDGLREWLAARAEAERAATGKMVDEIRGAVENAAGERRDASVSASSGSDDAQRAGR
jgi:hypothetical protein